MTETSVIIPTYNEEKDIVDAIKSLKKQIYKRFEIIVVDDGSTDNTVKNIRKFEEVKIIKGQHKGPGFSRNLGAKKAKGKILVFIDADMTFDKNYVKKLVEPLLKNKKIIGTTHELEIVKNTKNTWSRCWGKIRVDKNEAKDVKIFRAMRRKCFLDLGGFDPKYGYADDQTFWFKHKIKPLVAEDTICYHKNPETLKEVYKQSRWIGASFENKIYEFPVIKYLVPLIYSIISPFAIPLLAIRRCFRNRDFKILPQMMVFMMVRYFGTVEGIYRKTYKKINFR